MKKADAHWLINSDVLYWPTIFTYWCDMNYHKVETVNAVKKQIIWCNSHIRVNNQIIYNKKAHLEGINIVNDLLKPNNEFKTLQEIQELTQGIDWLQYNSIIMAIPKKWKNILRTNYGHTDSYKYLYDKSSATKPTPIIYKTLVYKPTQLRFWYDRWAKLIPEMEYTAFHKVFQQLYCVTISTKL